MAPRSRSAAATTRRADAAAAELVVSAASSLEPAFTAYAEAAGIDAKQSFAGSDDLAAQIRQGVKPGRLRRRQHQPPRRAATTTGWSSEPVVFATNTLVLAVPADSQIDSLDDLADRRRDAGDRRRGRPGRRLHARGARRAARRPRPRRSSTTSRSLEPDVAGIVGKLTQGAVDAGFVYITDVVATDGALEAIDLPADLQPDVAYGAAVVEGAENPDGAQAFIDGLLAGDGRRRARATPASGRRRAEAVIAAGSFAVALVAALAITLAVPDPARGRDLRRHGAGAS